MKVSGIMYYISGTKHSIPDTRYKLSRGGEIGIHVRFRCVWEQSREGSSPSRGTRIITILKMVRGKLTLSASAKAGAKQNNQLANI